MGRWHGLAVAVLCCGVAHAMPGAPEGMALSAMGNMVIGNSTRVVVGAAPAVAAPIACEGAVMLAERSLVGEVHARSGATSRLLAAVEGDVHVARGAVDFGPHTHVTGDVHAAGNVVIGLASVVDGAVVSRGGGVSAGRLTQLHGDVFAARDWRGDRDVVVGTPGTTLAVKGRALLRDRSEYFATILHEGLLTLVSGGPILHVAPVLVPAGSLHAPDAEAFALPPVTLDDVVADGADRVVAGDEVLAPGVYGRLVLQQRATARLVAGDYAFASIDAASDARFVAELPSAAPALRLLVARDVSLGRRVRLDVGGPLDVDAAAAGVVVQANGAFALAPDGVWIGTVLGRTGVSLGKHVMLRGAAWSGGPLTVGRDSVVAWVPSALAR